MCLSLNIIKMTNINNNKNIGEIGENMACDFLVKNKYRILFRNYKQGFDEIDIIAKSFDGILVFIEVKTLRGENMSDLEPEDNLTKSKLKKTIRACRLFVGFHKNLADGDRGWRIDLIAITLGKDGTDIISHYENIAAK